MSNPNRIVVDGVQKMTPSEAFIETLVAQGVTDVFGIVGSAFMDALDIFPAAGIRFIPVAHEQGAVHMADGYARVSGRHGVCIGQNGPGVTNFVTGLAAAYWAHSPVVMITPETGSMTMGLGGFQETEQLPIFSKITKYQAHVMNPRRMAELTSRAFDRALLEMGPTQVNIPRDFFYGDIECEIPKPIRVKLGAGSEKALEDAADLLASAKFPVILAGGGVIMSGGTKEAIALAEFLNAPVANSYLHNDSFPASHPLWVGPLGYQGSKAAMKLISKADVVLALGTRLGPFGTLPQHGLDYWPKNAKIIQIDADGKMLGLVKPISVGINGDAKEAAAALLAKLKTRNVAAVQNKAERDATIKSEKKTWEDELNTWTHEKDPYSMDMIKDSKAMHPREMLRAIEKALPKNSMVSTDIGNICSVSNSYLRFDEPRSMFAAMSFGNCGYAFPVAIGAKIAAPNRPAFAYVGDGAWGISLNELLTCAREKIGVTVILFNNGQWGAEKKNHVDFYSRRYQGVELVNPSWAAVAKSFGCEGITVDKVTDVGAAIQTAVKNQAEGKTTVLEMMVTKELGDPFRRDALSKPVRHLDKYKSFV
ncbi:MAG: sulfoacetaldehyde acetyltransferase [Burkholderiaceae bacterium]|nr:sulfoacetaldehyde acetyltransferase [Polynucleobacter sp.]NCU93197.1 sulfoacetaldehyde acetyltransferase [Burkholderiaceae bacterium]NCV93878.1 sulfoacetaldehyde acetyltransferase [Burkholderiaceae bacterium]NDC20658.1 sulfoacetaldehyde acetyltransferase [Burkholderiaceae bacterium]NDH55404.1 sulfoacetaldehyde acetyltransferase [Burkholderiaceae bacterium]